MPTEKVRARHTLHGDGKSTTDFSVFCVHRAVSISVGECSRCDDCEGFTFNPAGHNSVARCSRPPDPSTAERALDPEAKTLAGKTPIGGLMTVSVWCVTDDVRVESVTTMLHERGISGAPVVDAQGRPIGLVTKTDLLRRYQSAAKSQTETEGKGISQHEIGLATDADKRPIADAIVGEIMTPLAFTLAERSPMATAAALMAYEGVHRIPVVSEAGQVVGILSALDIVRWVAREDGFVIP